MKTVVASALVAAVLTATATAATVRLVTSHDIRDHTIQLVDLSPSTARALRGQRGPAGQDGTAGPAGAPGPQGAQGQPGTAGGFNPAKVTQATSAAVTVPPFPGTNTVTVSCPSGSTVIGGGAGTDGDLFVSMPTETGWYAAASNPFASPVSLYARAICASP